MKLHGAPLVRCPDPECIKCHCNECEEVRQNSKRQITGGNGFAMYSWFYPVSQIGMAIRMLSDE